ncbi:MAG: NAD(P)-binding domain-containing protein [Cyanobacteria bacterium P01_H01_bin.15]
MGTIAPDESSAITDAFKLLDAIYLEASVLGSIPQAKTGSLRIMVGADPVLFTRYLPILQALGPNPTLIGPVGTAAAFKHGAEPTYCDSYHQFFSEFRVNPARRRPS